MSSRQSVKRPAASSGLVLRGASGWSAYHERQYGSARWKSLLRALAGEGRFAAFVAAAETRDTRQGEENSPSSLPPKPHRREVAEGFGCTYTGTSASGEVGSELRDAELCGARGVAERNAGAARYQDDAGGFSHETREDLIEFLHLRPSGLPSPNVFLVAGAGEEGEETPTEAGHHRQNPESKSKDSHASCDAPSPVSSPLSPSGTSAMTVSSAVSSSRSSPSDLSSGSASSSPLPSSLVAAPCAAPVSPSISWESSPPACSSNLSASSASCSKSKRCERSAQERAWLESLEKEKVYYLDGASAFAACALGVSPGERVLDLCAAPGGKSLVLASMLFPSSPCLFGNGSSLMQKSNSRNAGLLVCNEASRPRMERLQRVLHTFLSPEIVKKRLVQVTCASGTKGGAYERFAPFDTILVDAPCSSDRHLLKQGKSALALWASGTPKAHAERQLQLLKEALRLLRVGGVLLYSTCALSEVENEKVVEKLLKSCGSSVKECSLLVDSTGLSSSSVSSEFSRIVVLQPTQAQAETAQTSEARETKDTKQTEETLRMPRDACVHPPTHSRRLSPGRCTYTGGSEGSPAPAEAAIANAEFGGPFAVLERDSALCEAINDLESANDSPVWILEKRERGAIMLPDTPSGFGPLYMCKLKLVAPLQRRL
ncbi:NOL1/NOP2/sun family protein [Toxoplasma gondii ME49]|uniref:NOL1/NOP2/Sun domain family member 4 n=2 Tax=Toxoplasma gondii TaxID=5811 RepID=S8FE72_TOXGM|nr:NOL1/NOP2/sun family protein [Toxoplasma gondii ME49]EPT32073.1 NOL1/NOP2/sun family protein [Toxoplasma gondii ME49]KYF42572.1 NOL1/NOP2/sun family protein [Toxoplasma gondii ARI]|eukprot:XP_018638313.1 NOL1/NOP2/sun family protein [Toxoplasma gondii ME49]